MGPHVSKMSGLLVWYFRGLLALDLSLLLVQLPSPWVLLGSLLLSTAGSLSLMG